MNWLQKVSTLETDWWRRWKHHLQNTIIHVFGPNSSRIKSSFGQYSLSVNFEVPAKGHVYDCTVRLNFNEYIADKVNYRDPVGTEVITQDVEGVEDLSSIMTGASVYILRDPGSGAGRGMGPVELLLQESTPFHIVDTLKQMIEHDRDDGDGGETTEDPTPDPEIDDLFPKWPYPEEEVDEEVMALLPGQIRGKAH